MNVSLVPVRLVVILLVVITGIFFALGILHWNPKRYACQDGQGFYGDWVTTLAIGKLEFRQKQWGCPVSQQYDPHTFKQGVNLNDAARIGN